MAQDKWIATTRILRSTGILLLAAGLACQYYAKSENAALGFYIGCIVCSVGSIGMRRYRKNKNTTR